MRAFIARFKRFSKLILTERQIVKYITFYEGIMQQKLNKHLKHIKNIIRISASQQRWINYSKVVLKYLYSLYKQLYSSQYSHNLNIEMKLKKKSYIYARMFRVCLTTTPVLLETTKKLAY